MAKSRPGDGLTRKRPGSVSGPVPISHLDRGTASNGLPEAPRRYGTEGDSADPTTDGQRRSPMTTGDPFDDYRTRRYTAWLTTSSPSAFVRRYSLLMVFPSSDSTLMMV